MIEKVLISISIVDTDLFDQQSIIEKCILESLENQYTTRTMIDHESNDYDFIIFSIAQQICEQLKISLVELIKLQIVKNYDDRLRLVIIHVIYSFMTIQNHTENLASLMITQLINHSIILKRS